MVLRNEDYMSIINEHFDITDTVTRKTVLSINEADKNQMLIALTSKLYDHIVDKVDDIDFGEIPMTKGDITKLSNYDDMLDCLQVIKDLLIEYRQSIDSVDTISAAIENVKKRKDLFEKGFRYKVELPIIMYSTIVLSIISSTSLLISSSIEFIKAPNQDTFDLMIDKVGLGKTKESLLFKDLAKFNKACSSGQLDSTLEYVIKNNIKNFTGAEPIILSGVGVVMLVGTIIPLLRELIFFFYYSRTQLADYLEIQAELLDISAYNLEHNENMEKEERMSIAKKQSTIADKLRKIASKVEVKLKKAEKDTSVEISSSNRKYKVKDVMEELPDSAEINTNSLF